MAELRGALGAVFKGAAAIYSKNLVFSDGSNTITNSDDLFVTKGFSGGQVVLVYGSTSNDGVYNVDTVAAGTLTMEETTVSETPSTAVLIYTAAPGTQVTGFYNWQLDWTHNVMDATDFADVGSKTYIAGDTGWTATAQAHWMTDEDVESLFGTELIVRFFVKYSASPSAPAPVYLYEGLAIMSGMQVDTNVNELVQRPLTFTGVGPLIYRAYTAYPS